MKILNILDTRDYEEGPNDKWIPIPGSGIENECQRCSKTHEVHVVVQDGDSVFTVGTGCAKKENMISDKQAKSGSSTAKTIAKWQARIIDLTSKAAEWKAIYEEEQTAYTKEWDAAAAAHKITNPYSRKYWFMDIEYRDKVAESKSRARMDIQEKNPVSLLETAQKSLSRAEKKMELLIN